MVDNLVEKDSSNGEELFVGDITAGDIEELRYSVDPWDLHMDQLSCGHFQANFSVIRLCDILLTRERWSHRVAAAGLTPAGYVAVAGTSASEGFNWCGSRIGPRRLVFAVDATEIDFVTNNAEDHWVVLISMTDLLDRLGEELAAELLRIDRTLVSDPCAIAQLSALVTRIIQFFEAHAHCAFDPRMLARFKNQLLTAVVQCLLLGQSSDTESALATQRFRAYKRARCRIQTDPGETTIEELLELTGVSRRSLEIGFSEMMAMSPQCFARHVRLNGWHRDLLLASSQLQTVTATAENWGFSELGRAAGYYRKLFGELPSVTLQRDGSLNGDRLVDALH